MTFRTLTIPFDDPDAFVEAFDDDPRELPDAEFPPEVSIPCPDHGDRGFTCCGVTRCARCHRVLS